jgi:prepilin-type N-terminal cleavage/methylation domain-containing protein
LEDELVKRTEQGFTLVELMIVVALIGILAGIAMPSYQKYVYKAEATAIVENVTFIKERLALLQAESGKNLTTDLEISTVGDSAGRHLEYRQVVVQGTGGSQNKTLTAKSISGIGTAHLFNRQSRIGIEALTPVYAPDKAGWYKIVLHLPTSDPCNAKPGSSELTAAEAAVNAAKAAIPNPTPPGWYKSHPTELAALVSANKTRTAAATALYKAQGAQESSRQVMLMAAHMLESSAREGMVNIGTSNFKLESTKLAIGQDYVTMWFSL